jgi:hypothetical protein
VTVIDDQSDLMGEYAGGRNVAIDGAARWSTFEAMPHGENTRDATSLATPDGRHQGYSLGRHRSMRRSCFRWSSAASLARSARTRVPREVWP